MAFADRMWGLDDGAIIGHEEPGTGCAFPRFFSIDIPNICSIQDQRGLFMGWEYHNRKRTKKGTWAEQDRVNMMTIRCTPIEYETIRGRAYARHMSISEYMRDLVQRDLYRYHYGIDMPTDGDAIPGNGEKPYSSGGGKMAL